MRSAPGQTAPQARPASGSTASQNMRTVPGNNTTVNRNTIPQRQVVNRVPAPTGSNGSTRNGTAKKIRTRRSPVKAILITLSIIIVLTASGFIALGFYVSSLDTIFPNVWTDGINLSGLTVNEATAHLIREGYENNAEGISATVIFPDDTSFSVTGNEVGLSFSAAEAAAAAFEFGRDGTFFANELQFINSLLDRTDLSNLSTPEFDYSILRSLAAESTETFNKTLFNSSLDHGESYITLIRGTGLQPAIENEVFDLALHTLNQAISEHDDLTVEYVPETNAGDSVASQINELQMLFDEIHKEPVSAHIMFVDDELVITESSNGLTFDFEAAVEMLREAMHGFPVTIPLEVLYPEYSTEEVRGWIFRDVLATSTTREQSGNANRLRNIELAAEKINNTVLNPGDEFSFNRIVGQRTAAAGFREANTIVGGIFEPGIGGGICQVSSTIHDAVVHTHLKVTERSPHGLRISYMPIAEEGLIIGDTNNSVGGRRFANDAMVNWGSNDYRFVNNTDFPIKVEAKVNGRNLTITLHGTNLDDTVIKVETVILSITPFNTVDVLTDTLPIGESRQMQGSAGISGYRAETFQLLFDANGELISRTSLGISRYNMQPRRIEVGTMPPDTPVGGGGGEVGGGPVGGPGEGPPPGGGTDDDTGTGGTP